MSDIERLKQRIAALEAALANRRAEDAEDEVADEDSTDMLAARIEALDRQLKAEDEEAEEEKEAADAIEDDAGVEDKKASEFMRGIEDEITKDRLREVERLQHGTELTTDTGMLQVSPTRSEYKEKLKLASARLDRIADYLEKHGYRELAFRVDKIADACDAKIKEGE